MWGGGGRHPWTWPVLRYSPRYLTKQKRLEWIGEWSCKGGGQSDDFTSQVMYVYVRLEKDDRKGNENKMKSKSGTY